MQDLAHYISFGVIDEPRTIEFNNGIQDLYIAAFNQIDLKDKDIDVGGLIPPVPAIPIIPIPLIPIPNIPIPNIPTVGGAPTGGTTKKPGFIETIQKGIKGLFIDPANVARALFTREVLGEVEGNLVELQRDFGEDYFNPDGSLNPKGSSALKIELAKKLGIPLNAIPKIRREHIVPVSAGGSNADDNLQLITAELHNSYTALDIAVGKAVKAGKITRGQAERLMRALKVTGEITLEEAFERLEELRSES